MKIKKITRRFLRRKKGDDMGIIPDVGVSIVNSKESYQETIKK